MGCFLARLVIFLMLRCRKVQLPEYPLEGGSPLIRVSGTNCRFRMRDERKRNEADPSGGIVDSDAPWRVTVCVAARILIRGWMEDRAMTDESRQCTFWHAGAVVLHRSLLGASLVIATQLSAATPASAVPSANPGDRAISRSAVMEDNPAITVDPTHANAFAIVFVRGDRCFVRTSTTSGKTWTAPVQLRSSVTDGGCVAADIAYAPDGNRIYAAYAEWGPENGYPQTNRILVSVSTNGGGAWDAPRVLLEGSSDPDGNAYLEPQIATPPIPSEARWSYVTAVEHSRSGAATVLLRSPDFGETWTETAWAGIRSAGWGETLPPLQATRHTIAAGPAGQVLLVSACGGCEDIAYPDGITRDQGIRLWQSSDHGASLASSTPVYARRGALAYNFPANVAWGWGQTAFGPAVEFGTGAVAHIVYPTNGHLLYIWAKPPYTTWSAPEQVDDSAIGTRQAPALQVRACGNTTYLHALWYDTRTDAAGQKFNVFYAQRAAADGGTWSNNVRASNAISYPEFPWSTTGLAVNGGTVFGVWPDRRDNGGYDMDIYGSPILSGLACP